MRFEMKILVKQSYVNTNLLDIFQILWNSKEF